MPFQIDGFRNAVAAACVVLLFAAGGRAQVDEAEEREGPKVYPISSVFLEAGEGIPTPTPRPSPAAGTSGPAIFSPREYSDTMLPAIDGLTSPGLFAMSLRVEPTATPVPPTPTPEPTATPTPYQAPTSDDPLDLNTATLEQLLLLPGVSPHRAELIIAHRRAVSGFRNVDQLRQVFGISEELFLKLRPLLRAGPVPASALRPEAPPFTGSVRRPAWPDGQMRPAVPERPSATGAEGARRPQPAVPAPPSSR